MPQVLLLALVRTLCTPALRPACTSPPHGPPHGPQLASLQLPAPFLGLLALTSAALRRLSGPGLAQVSGQLRGAALQVAEDHLAAEGWGEWQGLGDELEALLL